MIERFHRERNHSQNTIKNYNRSIHYYEQLTQHTIEECIEIAETEEQNNIRWKNTQTRKWLLQYREQLYTKYNVTSAQTYLTVIITFYRHYEITIPTLPYYSTKHLRHTTPINYSDLPDRELLQECLLISNPLVRSLILFMSSSGVSRIDVLNLTIQDYLDATKDFHNHPESVKYAVKEMQDTDVVPTFHLRRQKTGQSYFTFCSHEACKSINDYILTRTDKLTRTQPLFKINKRYINTVFERLNDYLMLGKVGNYNRLRPHMLRKYHASQLNQGKYKLSLDEVDVLQGRAKDSTRASYFLSNPEDLKRKYCLNMGELLILEAEKKGNDSELLELQRRYDELQANVKEAAREEVRRILLDLGYEL
jgi:integrase